jgi:FkbM family methyltransferase
LQQGRIRKDDYYNALTEQILIRVLKDTSVCVDVGCHCGSMLRLMKRYAPRGRFFAFEPIPYLHAGLISRFADEKTAIYDVALTNSSGPSAFKHVISNPGYSGLRERAYDRPNEQIEPITVQTDRLDAVLGRNGSPRVDFIKIDVEGADHLVMEGGERCVTRDRPVIVFEFGERSNGCYGTSAAEVFDYVTGVLALRISTLAGFLIGDIPLRRLQFCEHYRLASEYYFVAHPDRADAQY